MSVGEWVLVAYRVPREPSTPRIAIWRKLKQLGVAQIGDGLVALPADARTREQLEWVADDVLAAGGTASVWLARPASAAAERDLAAQMAAARAAEYTALTATADTAAALSGAERAAALRRLRAELRRIGKRDFFPPPERDLAHQAVRRLTEPDLTAEPTSGSRS
ncbi:Chromate resistance protein ChrB [Micromonospora echinospora]|uniref:Chromate resistance protein ChrB n=1 Tax=Micromonospora echinospora TaxID=1877 RepID=UPI0033E02696